MTINLKAAANLAGPLDQLSVSQRVAINLSSLSLDRMPLVVSSLPLLQSQLGTLLPWLQAKLLTLALILAFLKLFGLFRVLFSPFLALLRVIAGVLLNEISPIPRQTVLVLKGPLTLVRLATGLTNATAPVKLVLVQQCFAFGACRHTRTITLPQNKTTPKNFLGGPSKGAHPKAPPWPFVWAGGGASLAGGYPFPCLIRIMPRSAGERHRGEARVAIAGTITGLDVTL